MGDEAVVGVVDATEVALAPARLEEEEEIGSVLVRFWFGSISCSCEEECLK